MDKTFTQDFGRPDERAFESAVRQGVLDVCRQVRFRKFDGSTTINKILTRSFQQRTCRSVMFAPTRQTLGFVPYGAKKRDSFVEIPIGAIGHSGMETPDLFVYRSANDNARTHDAIGRRLASYEINQYTRGFTFGFLYPFDLAGFVNSCSPAESRRNPRVLPARRS